MLKSHLCLFAILTLSLSGLHAQHPPKSDKELVTEVFEWFFESMRGRDTTTIKSITYYKPKEPRRFFHTYLGNHHGIRAAGSGSVEGFIKSVGAIDNLIGKCNNKFDSITVRVYHRYATVNANYRCYLDSDSLDHSGTYTIHFLKPDDWKIERVIRYIDATNKSN